MGIQIPQEPVGKRLIDVNLTEWEKLDTLCRANKTSRTDAVNAAIKYMNENQWIPGRTKKGASDGKTTSRSVTPA